MQRAVICKGDRTSHGGMVIEGDERCTTGGRPIAKRGHLTSCPQCKGNFPIVDGLDFFTFFGGGTVVDKMKTACGAELIASQHAMTIDDRGAGGSASSAVKPAAAEFRGAFRALDEDSGAPCPNMRYRIVLSDGRTLYGTTDADGDTEYLTSKERATATLYWDAGNAGRDA
ncbi:MAG TPA: PAAR domain-containing protein [Telluria sp.]|nr:PAAR domain-containing protein [Telluria sp.]